MIDDAAQLTRLQGERPASAFSRYFSDPANVELRRAHALTKSTPAPVTLVDPVQASDYVSNASAAAYQKLQKMAGELRTRSPELSEAQAFAKVFTAPENSALANQAHRRPSATTSFAYPV